MLVRAALVAGFLALGSCAAPLAPPTVGVTYVNPVLDADFPDPTVIRAPDGFYYGYATQSQRGDKWLNIQVARSSDLVHWQELGDALPAKPNWAANTQDFWAPHVTRDGARYLMYYSAKPDTSDERHGLCLAVATAAAPSGPFVDMGHPLLCGETFVDIDPMAFDEPATGTRLLELDPWPSEHRGTGRRLLYWGSGFKPLKVQELSADRMSFAPGSASKDLVCPNPDKDAVPVWV